MALCSIRSDLTLEATPRRSISCATARRTRAISSRPTPERIWQTPLRRSPKISTRSEYPSSSACLAHEDEALAAGEGLERGTLFVFGNAPEADEKLGFGRVDCGYAVDHPL